MAKVTTFVVLIVVIFCIALRPNSALLTETLTVNSITIFYTKSGTLEKIYLGLFNGRLYFLDITNALKLTAEANCRAAGMKLVTFDGRKDFNWVQSRLGGGIGIRGLYWSAGTNIESNSCFQSGEKAISSLFTINPNTDYKMGLMFQISGVNLFPTYEYNAAGYVCFG